MPRRRPTTAVCNTPGCPELAPPGHKQCPQHQPTPWAGRTYKGFPTTIRRQIITQADGHCANCGQPSDTLEADHITPHSEGGPPTLDNGQALCPPCHHQRSTQQATQARWRNGKKQLR